LTKEKYLKKKKGKENQPKISKENKQGKID